MDQDCTLTIRGMNCGHCVTAVRRELERLEGVRVRDVRIGGATVTFDDTRVRRQQIDHAVEQAGFEVVS
jgi:copper chaperone